ncbi:MAG: hypothetical protein IJ115_10350 [Erysipelotrichaceae bacterium]|nr:hypothetical protein [Erysipelotrichaceae bacterium]
MMRKRRIVTAIVGVAALLVVLFAIVISNSNSGPTYTKDEIGLQIQLDLNEDIGLFIIHSDIDGNLESGGVSNANKSLLKKNELLFWTLSREYYENMPDTVDLKLKFDIVTEYYEPNYENIYPEESVVPVDGEVSLNATFGEVYKIKVTGDKVNGYRATIEQ